MFRLVTSAIIYPYFTIFSYLNVTFGHQLMLLDTIQYYRRVLKEVISQAIMPLILLYICFYNLLLLKPGSLFFSKGYIYSEPFADIDKVL